MGESRGEVRDDALDFGVFVGMVDAREELGMVLVLLVGDVVGLVEGEP